MKTLRKYHKWPSLVIGFFLILFSLSGIILNHRQFFSPVNVSRNLLPPVYRYNNWNLAAIKGNISLGNDRQLVYGNIGIWACDSSFSRFTDFNQGFNRGIDHRKVFTMLQTSNNQLLAGTLYGLWQFDRKNNTWVKLTFPEKNPRIVKLAEYDGQVYIMTRDHLYRLPLGNLHNFRHLPLSVPEGADGKASLFITLWVLHNGELMGLAGKLLVDLVGIVLIFISLSGFYYTLMPIFAKRSSKNLRLKLHKFNRTSINWHTKIGVYGLLILIITIISGMFLRPPLLIPIAGSRVAPIPGTMLDNDNHWHDKLRDFAIDSNHRRIIISTSEGFFETGVKGEDFCRPFRVQPPVSVMGITVFDQVADGSFVVGSFSGLYRWYPEKETIINMITGQLVTQFSQGNPFGATAVSGIIRRNSELLAFIDYDGGWIPLKPGMNVPEMPDKIKKSPVSLWNVGLEVHTGRIFSVFLGSFYILYVPLMGLTTLLILITGFLMWYKSNKRRKKNQTNKTQIHEYHQIKSGT
ncbi:MAG: PepSY-associated TM helix domain-containing protein [Bacteroidota bacterium]